MGVLIAVTIIIGSLSWFTANRAVETSGMGIKAGGPRYEVFVLEGTNGKYYDPYHMIIRKDTESQSLVWQMTENENMGNDENSSGIKPGSAGKISFYITPRVDTLNLDFSFEIIGYKYSEDEEKKTNADTGEEETVTVKNMTALTSASADENDAAVAGYLNGHILLFSGRNGNGSEESPFVYTGLISSNEDMKRVLANQPFSDKKDTNQRVDIYWVWPETLSTLVDATSCELMEIKQIPFTAEDDVKHTRAAILENILDYPQYYFKNVSVVKTTATTTDDITGETVETVNREYKIDGNPGTLDGDTLAERYDIYGDYYDRVDNSIGLRVNYLLLKLDITEGAAVQDIP